MSLDNYLHDHSREGTALAPEDKEKFQTWVSRILSDPSSIAITIENALKDGMYSEWEAESASHKFKLGSYYPSMIEKCLRAQAYSYLSPLPPTPEDLAIFGEGKAIHELIALALRRSGLISVEGSEVEVNLQCGEEAKLHGRIDDLLLIRLSEAGDHFKLFIPLEIKSTSTLPEEPRPSHYYQLSTYLLAQDYPFGVLLYWAKREGKVKGFTIPKDDVMQTVLRERVLELHDALKSEGLPQKEAANLRDYGQCERCSYADKCNPFLIETVPRNSKIALFDLDSTVLDTSQKKRMILQELGLSPSARVSDINDEEIKKKYWELLDSPRFVEHDVLIAPGKEKVYEQQKLGRVPVGISSSRRDHLLEVTRARLANLGVPIFHLILREPGNYEVDGRFKAKWAQRLAVNYDIVEFFDRDAVTSSMIMKGIQSKKENAG
ncbi:MAG TPA: PD-(D/E)XK nuclease family protein [Nitrososphaerales archaeon]|nr:PD-(D/E)XK nuclease family protein [Nitrososphaerales archaeon]